MDDREITAMAMALLYMTVFPNGDGTVTARRLWRDVSPTTNRDYLARARLVLRAMETLPGMRTDERQSPEGSEAGSNAEAPPQTGDWCQKAPPQG